MKITENPSSYKSMMKTLDVEHPVIASQLAGDFLLPISVDHKLGFIAGGIGVTPFRSHVKWMLDSNRMHDTALYYCVNSANEMAYQDLWREAEEKFSFTLVPVAAKEVVQPPQEQGYVTKEMIIRRTPDYLERTWYISGPPGMVTAYKQLLRSMGVKQGSIKTDFFPGA